MTSREQRKIKLERVADLATRWIGSISSLIFHSIFFVIAFILPKVGVITFERMLLVLTTVVSLEAIYLAIFIQMSVNKNSEDIEISRKTWKKFRKMWKRSRRILKRSKKTLMKFKKM